MYWTSVPDASSAGVERPNGSAGSCSWLHGSRASVLLMCIVEEKVKFSFETATFEKKRPNLQEMFVSACGGFSPLPCQIKQKVDKSFAEQRNLPLSPSPESKLEAHLLIRNQLALTVLHGFNSPMLLTTEISRSTTKVCHQTAFVSWFKQGFLASGKAP